MTCLSPDFGRVLCRAPILWFALFAFGCAHVGEVPPSGQAATDGTSQEIARDAPQAHPSKDAVSAQPPAALDPDAIAAPEADGSDSLLALDPLADQIESVLEARAPKLEAAERRGIAEEFARAEREDGLPALMLVALIAQESRFNPKAVGPRGSMGLLQIRPWVAADIAHRHKLPLRRSEQLYNPVLNVRVGVAFLAEIHEEFEDLELSLAAYHIGPTRVRRRAKQGWRPKGPYVRRVMGRYQALRIETGELKDAVGG